MMKEKRSVETKWMNNGNAIIRRRKKTPIAQVIHGLTQTKQEYLFNN